MTDVVVVKTTERVAVTEPTLTVTVSAPGPQGPAGPAGSGASGPAAITYDTGGNLASYAGPGPDLSAFTYDADGNLTGFTEDGVARTLTYTDGNLTGVS